MPTHVLNKNNGTVKVNRLKFVCYLTMKTMLCKMKLKEKTKRRNKSRTNFIFTSLVQKMNSESHKVKKEAAL